MRHTFTTLTFLTVIFLLVSWTSPVTRTLSSGMQPQVSIDKNGVVRIVFGRNDSIFCATSINQGISFSDSRFVGQVAGMALGMSRGPQLASSLNFSVITAIGKSGDIHFFQLNHSGKKWIKKGIINDVKSSAPEALMHIAADNRDNFYAVWLDLRLGKGNNIYFSSLAAAKDKWANNTLVYESPDNHVCDCCKPNIVVKNGIVAIMFRNWLGGSRDLYLTKSADKGKSFETAQKLGMGTWKLKGCPMDGGGLAIDNSGKIQTTWQRQGVIYTCKPGENEIKLAPGKISGITANVKNDQLIISYQDGENTKLIDSRGAKELMTVKGSYLRPLILRNRKILCVWELNKTVMFRLL